MSPTRDKLTHVSHLRLSTYGYCKGRGLLDHSSFVLFDVHTPKHPIGVRLIEFLQPAVIHPPLAIGEKYKVYSDQAAGIFYSKPKRSYLKRRKAQRLPLQVFGILDQFF